MIVRLPRSGTLFFMRWAVAGYLVPFLLSTASLIKSPTGLENLAWSPLLIWSPFWLLLIVYLAIAYANRYFDSAHRLSTVALPRSNLCHHAPRQWTEIDLRVPRWSIQESADIFDLPAVTSKYWTTERPNAVRHFSSFLERLGCFGNFLSLNLTHCVAPFDQWLCHGNTFYWISEQPSCLGDPQIQHLGWTWAFFFWTW